MPPDRRPAASTTLPRMDKLAIQGGVPLRGEVRVSGAKNAALPIMCAALLSAAPLRLANVPRLRDVRTMMELLAQMGVGVERDGDAVLLAAQRVDRPVAPYELVKTMRASILVLGPLVARGGEARVSLPGRLRDRPASGRPAHQGARSAGRGHQRRAGVHHRARERLKGARYEMDLVTVTGTENLMMAATLAEGTTVLENAAREPEVVDLANCLNAMGARMTGAGTDVITIEGVERLGGAAHRIMPDRIETGTYLAAAAATRGAVTLHDADAGLLDAVIEKLREAGATIETGDGTIHLEMTRRPRSVDVDTAPHPGFPTDMQAQLMALDAIAEGTATITENIFENRFMHVLELRASAPTSRPRATPRSSTG